MCIDVFLSKIVYHSKETQSTAQTAIISTRTSSRVEILTIIPTATLDETISTEGNTILPTYITNEMETNITTPTSNIDQFPSKSFITATEITKQNTSTPILITTATTTSDNIKPSISTATAEKPKYDYSNVQIIGVG